MRRRYHLILAIKAGDVVGTGKNDALDTVLAGRFIEVVDTQNIALQYGSERTFLGHAAHMHNRVTPLDGLTHGIGIGQVCHHDFFTSAGGSQVAAIRQAQHIAIGF